MNPSSDSSKQFLMYLVIDKDGNKQVLSEMQITQLSISGSLKDSQIYPIIKDNPEHDPYTQIVTWKMEDVVIDPINKRAHVSTSITDIPKEVKQQRINQHNFGLFDNYEKTFNQIVKNKFVFTFEDKLYQSVFDMHTLISYLQFKTKMSLPFINVTVIDETVQKDDTICLNKLPVYELVANSNDEIKDVNDNGKVSYLKIPTILEITVDDLFKIYNCWCQRIESILTRCCMDCTDKVFLSDYNDFVNFYKKKEAIEAI